MSRRPSRSNQGFDDRCNSKEAQRHVHPDFNSDPRFHENDPSGHAGAARKGCVQRPAERISRRSQVHRPATGELASPFTGPAMSPGVAGRPSGTRLTRPLAWFLPGAGCGGPVLGCSVLMGRIQDRAAVAKLWTTNTRDASASRTLAPVVGMGRVCTAAPAGSDRPEVAN